MLRAAGDERGDQLVADRQIDGQRSSSGALIVVEKPGDLAEGQRASFGGLDTSLGNPAIGVGPQHRDPIVDVETSELDGLESSVVEGDRSCPRSLGDDRDDGLIQQTSECECKSRTRSLVDPLGIVDQQQQRSDLACGRECSECRTGNGQLAVHRSGTHSVGEHLVVR